MVKLLTILLLSNAARAQVNTMAELRAYTPVQCDTSMIYGMKLRFEVDVNTNKWKYYNSTGKPVKTRTFYDSTLILKGGYAMRVTVSKVIDGYGDLKIYNPSDCEFRLYRAFDGNLQEINGYIKSWKFKN